MNVSKAVKVLVVVFISTIAVVIFGGECQALSRYYGNYAKCIAESGGRGGIESVAWACNKAASPTTVDSGNSCSLWIGSTTNSTIPEITVYSETGTATIMYWGMCTDFIDTTARVWVNDDGDAIDDSMNVTRPRQPSVGGQRTTLDIAKLIAVASKQKISECETVYTKTIIVGRQHGTSGSTHEMPQTIKLRVISGKDCNKGDTCNDWAPASYKSSNQWGGTTSIDVRIKNMAGRFGGTGFGAWNNNDIWAMPTDRIAWITCYYPGVQKTAFTDVGSVNHGDPWLGYDDSPLPTDRCEPNIRKVIYKKLHTAIHQPWENKYIITGEDDGGATEGGPFSYTGTIGDSSIKMSLVYRQTVEGDAGKTFTTRATTGKPVKAVIDRRLPWTEWFAPCHQKVCAASDPKTGACIRWEYPECACCEPWNIEGRSTGHHNTYEKTLNDASVTYGPVFDKLSVRLQYNFTVTTDLSINKNLVYSGEKDQIKVNEVTTTVHTRYNPVTIADYATQVPNAQIVLYTYVHSSSDGGGIGGMLGGSGDVCEVLGSDAKQCLWLKDTSKTLNAGGSLGGSTDTIWSNLPYNAFDAAAGDYMCFASAVSPSDVAGDMDMAGGNGVWIFSDPACAVIAKKPAFQVWGDSLYSVGSIETSIAKKVNIYNAYFSDNSGDRTKLCNGSVCFEIEPGKASPAIDFGSWVEESLILKNGLTSTVASGAAMGLNDNYAHAGTTGEFCKARSPLSFANNCQSVLGTNSVGASGIDRVASNREELIDYWIGSGTDKGSCGNKWGGTCRKLESANNKNIYYVSGGNLSVSGNIPKDTTYLVKASGTVTISGNLKYNTNTYNHIGEVPKVIIYANNFNISCNVDEVDAILITAPGGNVNTCAGGGDESDPKRDRQLKIFGTVMTDSINLGRTYGTAANQTGSKTDPFGMPSDGAAAEVFDYDTSILMWSEFMSGSGESDTLNTTYQHELAPRY